ncbi:MAG: type IV secretory system conjugative DNA transfer family protein [bacterium]|nr:type IV secretory system conjugative DNA transfer family protein [bacterium]
MIGFLRILLWPIIISLAGVVTTLVKSDIWITMFDAFKDDPINISIWILTVLFLAGLGKKYFRLWYAVRQSKNLIALRIILPRGDSKIDQEKRLDKDFKEKLAIMEQLYRALWEVRSLTIWQSLHYWFFRHITISMEMFVIDGQLIYYVVTQPKFASIIEKQITSFYPDAEVYPDVVPDMWDDGKTLVGYNMVTKKQFMYPLRYYEQMQDDPLNGLGNVLSKMSEGEKAAIQIVMAPVFTNKYNSQARARASMLFKGNTSNFLQDIPGLSILAYAFDIFKSSGDGTSAPGAKSGDSFVRMIQPEEELYKRMGEKAGMSFYHCSIRILASTDSYKRGIEVTNNLQVAFNAFKDLYGNFLVNKRMIADFLPLKWNAKLIYKVWKLRLNGFFSPQCLLVEKELAGLYHFPDSRYNKIPIIQWATYKVLPPPPDAPHEGILLGNNIYRGLSTPVHFLGKDRTRHHYVIGKSGSGKSALLSYMCRQDIANGDGLCLIDPHGDLVEDALAHTPKERAKEVIVFDPSDIQRPMGINMLEATTPEEKDRAALDAMEIFIKLFGNEIFGPRIQHYFRNGALTLMDDEEEGATLIDVPRMFVDDEFQRYKVAKIKNPVVRSFWEFEMAQTGDREKQEMIPYFSSKFGPFITNTIMRNIIGQPKSAFNIRELMDTQKVLLVNLSKGKIGDTNAELLGLIFVNKISMAAMGRADMPRPDRKRFYLYVDEFQNFVTDAFATILSEARKYELALVMAHQYIGQLVMEGQGGTKMRDAVFGNVGTMMSFKVGAEDAEYLSKEFAPVLSEQDVIGIPNFNCYTKLNINNVTSRPFSLATIWDESDRNEDLGKLIKEYCRLKYARKKIFVDQEIADRIGLTK